jgi:hypothetical protein
MINILIIKILQLQQKTTKSVYYPPQFEFLVIALAKSADRKPRSVKYTFTRILSIIERSPHSIPDHLKTQQ